jgi:hypothetical protein
MKSILALFLLLSSTTLSQNMNSHQNISQEAYFDYIKKGGIASEWPRYESQYTEQYKQQNFNPTGGSEYQRKTTTVAGLITNSYGQTIGSYSNGQVLNSGYQPIGYNNNGTFMRQSGLNSGCAGYVRGNQILNCQGGVIYSINGSSITNSNGFTVAYIRGSQIYNSSNQLLANISGANINSIAVYLLFFAR